MGKTNRISQWKILLDVLNITKFTLQEIISETVIYAGTEKRKIHVHINLNSTLPSELEGTKLHQMR